MVDPMSASNVLELMNITNIEASSDKIKLQVNLPYNLFVFDDVRAVVDGSFWAHVYQNKEYVGSTRISLPEEGLKGGSHSVSVWTSLGLNGSDNVSVELKPEALCLMEAFKW